MRNRPIQAKLFSALAGCFLWAALATAQDYPAPGPPTTWPEIRKSQPEGLQLKMTLPKDHFYQGEVLPTTLTFSNTSPLPYHVRTAVNDGTERMDIAFQAHDQEGKAVIDPLAWMYAGTQIHTLMGVIEEQDLGSCSISLPANQWLQFSKPGVYTLFATSTRVQKGTKEVHVWTPITLISDPVKITIDPLPPEIEKQTIVAARAKLALPDCPLPESIAPLRYLGTSAARHELIALLPQYRFSSEITLAFAASTNPEGDAREILAAVQQGSAPLRGDIVALYTSLKSRELTKAQGDTSKFTYQIVSTEKAAREEIFAAGFTATGGKGPAYLDFLVQFSDTSDQPFIRAELATHQSELSQEQAEKVLGDGNKISGEDLLPLARKMAAEPFWNVAARRTLARWKPEEAQALVVADVWLTDSGYKASRADARTMDRLHLPVTPMPELDLVLEAKLARGGNTGLTSYYLQQFGTPKLLPAAIDRYRAEGINLDATVQKFFLWYWLRCDPQGGTEALAQALQARPPEPKNYRYVLKDVLVERWTPEALPLVLGALDDPDMDVVLSAITVLEAHGGPDSVAPAIAALKKVSAAPAETSSLSGNSHAGVPQALAKKLLESKSWTYTPEQARELKGLAEKESP